MSSGRFSICITNEIRKQLDLLIRATGKNESQIVREVSELNLFKRRRILNLPGNAAKCSWL